MTVQQNILTLATQVVRKLIANYNRELSQLEITTQQMIALRLLCLEEGLSLGEFAKKLKIRKSTAVSMIKRLEIMELVTKEPHPEDARLNVLKPTHKTHELMPKIREKIDGLENAIETHLGASSLEKLSTLLSMLLSVEPVKEKQI